MTARTHGILDARRVRVTVAASCVGSLFLAYACGGTNGHEGLLVSGPDASSTPGDSTVDLDSGAFDVQIFYADRVLPDVVVPPDATDGMEAGSPYPDCPPFLAIDPDGDPVDPTVAFNEIPTAHDDAGRIVPAPDGSPCAEYPWLGSTAIDSCVASNDQAPFVALPPCNWCAEAGVAAAGMGQGQPRYDLCLDLYACVIDSGCATTGYPQSCLCGPDIPHCSTDASGPCAAQELAALEYSATSADLLKNFSNAAPNAATFLGFCGSNLNAVLQLAVSNSCFPPIEAGAGQ